MSMYPPFLALLGIVLFGIVTVSGTFFDGTGSLVDARSENAKRASDLAGTSISLEVAAIDGATVTIDVVNSGRVPLRDFAVWDVWADYHEPDGTHHAERLAYTSAPAPTGGEWAVDGIYLDAVQGLAEGHQPGILDPGETARIVARAASTAGPEGPNSLAVATPNGVRASTTWTN